MQATLLLAIALSACSVRQQAGQKSVQPEPQKFAPAKVASGDLLGDALRLYHTGKFEDAAEEYTEVLNQDPHSAEAYAGLTRCYLKEGQVQPAYENIQRGRKAAPDSETLRVVLGEVYFRQGKMHDAEQAFMDATSAEAPEGRAYLGLARVSTAFSMRARAKQMLARAHELDSDDPEIEWLWLNTLPRAARIKAVEGYLAAAQSNDSGLLEDYKNYLESLKQEEKQPPRECELVSRPKTAKVYLWPMFVGPPYINGYGLDFKINGRQSRLLLDTGVSGILLTPGEAERAGILPTAQSKITGIGDKGETDLYIGYADSIKIGALEFRNCPVEVSAKKATDHDGLVGADLFAHYLVTIDFPGHELRLSELPKPPEDPPRAATSVAETNAGPPPSAAADPEDSGFEDRYIAPEMRDYTSVFRFGHMLLVPTVLNDAKSSKLFLLDSGANHNHISPEAAREVTKVHDDDDTNVLGLNGKVKKVFRADKVTLSFGRYKQENQDLVAFDLSKLSQDAGTEISGTLGFALLRMLKITIDYRDGLVDFSYDFSRIH
ncbi:MAG TPA: aspartyl protease family protein [Candidatus Angelobacter sp.]|nr:aspartyl protease family protein [Candidatus Angelobacter sp.]